MEGVDKTEATATALLYLQHPPSPQGIVSREKRRWRFYGGNSNSCPTSTTPFLTTRYSIEGGEEEIRQRQQQQLSRLATKP
jgi:hypothetical protein